MGVEIIGNTRRFTVTPVITAGAYAANDAVGGKLTFELLPANYPERYTGIIQSLLVAMKSGTNTAFDLILFGSDFTPTADNAPFDPSDADMANIVACIRMTTNEYFTFTDNQVAAKAALAIPFVATTRFLYGQLVWRSVVTFTETDAIQVGLTVLAD